MINVAMVGPFPLDLEEPVGGVERSNLNLVRALVETGEVDVTAIVNYPSTRHRFERDYGFVKCIYLPQLPGATGWLKTIHRDIPHEIHQLDLDVVHIQGIASLAARMPGALLTIHGNAGKDAWRNKHGAARYVSSALGYSLEVIPRACCRNIITLRQDRKGTYIPNACDPEPFQENRTTSGAIDKWIAIGAVSPLKNQLGMIRAIAAMPAGGLKPHLTIVGGTGDSAYFAECVSLVSQLQLTEQVIFTGHLPARGVQRLLAESGVLLHLSKQENSPMVIAEALAYGCRVIATAVGNIPAMLRGIPGCKVVDPAEHGTLSEAMTETLNNSSNDGAQARQMAARTYHPGRVATQTLQLYKAILTKGDLT